MILGTWGTRLGPRCTGSGGAGSQIWDFIGFVKGNFSLVHLHAFLFVFPFILVVALDDFLLHYRFLLGDHAATPTAFLSPGPGRAPPALRAARGPGLTRVPLVFDTLRAEPVALGDGLNGRDHAVGVVTLVTTVTQQHRVFIILALANLKKEIKINISILLELLLEASKTKY